MLDRNTGKLLGEEHEGVAARTFHSNWSSPSFGSAGGKDQIIFGSGDGWCYGFDANATQQADGVDALSDLWRFDCNLPQYRAKNGKPQKYATYDGPSEVIATPVYYKNRVYVAIGQDPEHGEGLGDITTSGKIWNYDKIHRSLSTPAIYNGLVFMPDFSGFIHCLDAETGKPYWVYDTKSHIWGSPLVADGKVYVGTEDGDFIIMSASKEMKVINKVDMRSPIYASPVIANGTLYVTTPTHLYAIGKK
jgi:outer membrane protein assembly factor BamB